MIKRALVAVVAVAAAAAIAAGSGLATIHPLTVGWICGNFSGDPPAKPRAQRPIRINRRSGRFSPLEW